MPTPCSPPTAALLRCKWPFRYTTPLPRSPLRRSWRLQPPTAMPSLPPWSRTAPRWEQPLPEPMSGTDASSGHWWIGRRRRSLLQAVSSGRSLQPRPPVERHCWIQHHWGGDIQLPIPQCYAKTLFGAGSKETIVPTVNDSTVDDLDIFQMVGIYVANGSDIGKFCVPTLEVNYLPPLPSVTLGALEGGSASTVTGAVSALTKPPSSQERGTAAN